MRATYGLVASVGCAEITMAMVADEADIHVTTLFTHFDSKADLFAALSEPAIRGLQNRVESNMGKVKFLPFLNELQVEFAEKYEQAGQKAINSSYYLRSQVELLPAWLQFEKRQIELFADYMSHDYEMTPLQARMIAGMIVSASIFTYDQWLDNYSNQSLVDSTRENLKEIEKILTRSFHI